jgi:hypothetical protein
MPKRDISSFAIVNVPIAHFENYMNEGSPDVIPIHGIRDIKICHTGFVVDLDLVVFLIYSKDIPAYVATMKAMGTLDYQDIFDPEINDTYRLPIAHLEFDCVCDINKG